MPSGYTESNSRRIGGFHYQDAFINSRFVWDLKYKPSCSDPRGMARTIGGFSADIYLPPQKYQPNGAVTVQVSTQTLRSISQQKF
uniref:phage major tropism determinant n=1 Tax=Vibrio cholerae TaxID=666 RepID=UPI003F5893CF